MALSVAERNASDPFQACPWVSNEVGCMNMTCTSQTEYYKAGARCLTHRVRLKNERIKMVYKQRKVD